VLAHAAVAGVDDDLLAGLQVLERGEADVGELLVARVDHHDGDDVVLRAASASARSKPVAKKSLINERDARRFVTFTSVSSASSQVRPGDIGAGTEDLADDAHHVLVALLRGEDAARSTSVARISPTRSLFLIAVNAHRAHTSAATRALDARRVPNAVDCDMSTTSMTVISRSSVKTFTNASLMRAETFQSIQLHVVAGLVARAPRGS
jgi:hypothetical protein